MKYLMYSIAIIVLNACLFTNRENDSTTDPIISQNDTPSSKLQNSAKNPPKNDSQIVRSKIGRRLVDTLKTKSLKDSIYVKIYFDDAKMLPSQYGKKLTKEEAESLRREGFNEGINQLKNYVLINNYQYSGNKYIYIYLTKEDILKLEYLDCIEGINVDSKEEVITILAL